MKNNDNNDGSSDSNNRSPKSRPQLTAIAPGAVSMAGASAIRSPATPSDTRKGVLRAAQKLASPGLSSGTIGNGSNSSAWNLCESCSAADGAATEAASPTTRCRQCRRRQLQRRVVQQASERSLFAPRSFRSAASSQGSVRRIRTDASSARDLGQYKLEMMDAANNTSNRSRQSLRSSTASLSSIRQGCDNDGEEAVEKAIQTITEKVNQSRKSRIVQDLTTIRAHLLHGGILRPPASFWSSLVQLGSNENDVDTATATLLCHILAAVDDVPNNSDCIQFLCDRIRRNTQKGKHASATTTPHALRAVTNLLWQFDVTISRNNSADEDDVNDRLRQQDDALLHTVLEVVHETLQHRDQANGHESDAMVEWSCRCYLALDGVMLERKGSKRRSSSTLRCWTESVVALLPHIQTDTNASHAWLLYVLQSLSTGTDDSNSPILSIAVVDEIATQIVRVLKLLVEEHESPTASRRPCFLFQPCCSILSHILPRCNNSTQLMPECQVIAGLCCDKILQDDATEQQEEDSTAETWEAAGRLLSTFASLYTVAWARTERVQAALLDTVELFMEYAPEYTEIVAHALWTMSCLDTSIHTESSRMEQQQRVLVLLSQAAQLCRGSPYHRTIVLAVGGICYNTLLCLSASSAATNSNTIVVPVNALGDALADHPQDASVAETVFAALTLVEDSTILQQVLQRPNVADAFIAAIDSDISIVQVVARSDLEVTPTLASLRNHAVRRLATAANDRFDLVAQVVEFVEPSTALVSRIVENLCVAPELATLALFRTAVHHPSVNLPLASITEGLQVAMKECSINAAICTTEFQENLCRLVWAIAPQADSDLNCVLFHLVLDVIRLHYTEHAAYQKEILRAAAGAVATLAPLVASCITNNAKDVAMVAEAAYKVLEEEGDLKMGNAGQEAIANCFVFLLCACNESLDVLYQSGMILLVSDVLESLPTCERVQEIGCQILSLFTSKDSVNMYLIIAETGSILQLAAALTSFPENKRIRSAAVSSLVHLSQISALRNDMVQSNVVNSIASLMLAHVDDELLRWNGIELINNLVSSATPISQRALIAKAMCSTLGKPSLRRNRLVLSCLFKISANGALPTDFDGFPDMLVQVIRKFYGVAAVVEPALAMLAQVVSNGKCRNGAVDVSTIAKAMLSLPESQPAQVNGCRCIGLTPCPADSVSLVLQTIAFSMRMFPDSITIQEAACHSMSMVLEEHGASASSYHVDAVMDAMRKHTMSRNLQHHGCLALCALSDASARENQAEMLPILIAAAENFPQECGRLAERALSC